LTDLAYFWIPSEVVACMIGLANWLRHGRNEKALIAHELLDEPKELTSLITTVAT
jgi:hypothetical protein